MHIKKEDVVEVVTGDNRGVTGRVLSVHPKDGKIVVEGVNKVYKHLRPSRRNPQGGRLSKEMPLNISNVMLVCATCRRGVRTGARYAADGSKERFCKKCGSGLGRLSKARKAHATKG